MRYTNPRLYFTSSSSIVVSSSSSSVGLGQRSYSTSGPVSAWMGDYFKTGKPPRHRTRHSDRFSLSHPWVGKNKYWVWLQPPLGKNGKCYITVGRVTRTAGILAYSLLKALTVNGAGHPTDIGRMLA